MIIDPTNVFSVVVPTRERADVLAKCLASVLAQNDSDMRVIVSDNCSQDETRDVVEACRDERVRYVCTERRVSMAENWEFALSHVEDGWVTILGDDDGLLPNALRRVREIVAETGVEAVRSAVCRYVWPSLRDGAHGHLTIPRGHGVSVRSSAHWLRAARDGRAHYTQLPMLYSGGFLSTAVLARVRRNGKVYGSCIPDVYSAIAAASVTTSYAYVEEPLAINGASAHSTGTAVFKKASGPSAVRFMSEGNLPFHPDVPLLPGGRYPHSFQALVLESYLQSAALRPQESVDWSAQLRTVLADAGGAIDPDLIGWARAFATLHRIDLDSVMQAVRWLRVTRRLERLPRRVNAVSPLVIEGCVGEELQDVFEAALVAQRTLAGLTRPDRGRVHKAAAWLDDALRTRAIRWRWSAPW